MFAQPALTPVEIDYQTLSRFVSTNLASSTLLRIEGSRKIQNVYFKTYVEKKRTTLYSKVRATPLSLEMLFQGVILSLDILATFVFPNCHLP